MIPFARSELLIGRRRLMPVPLLLVAVFAACTANPAVVATPTPTHAQPTATASPSPAPPTASPRTEPGPPGPLIVDWARVPGDTGLGVLEGIDASATLGDRLVIVGQRDIVDAGGGSHYLPGIWFSDDGLRWQAADVEDGEKEGVTIRDVTVGGPGLVAVGDEGSGDTVRAAVWSSTDGRSWARVHDDAFDPGRMWHVKATAQGLVAFGDDCMCIYSKEYLADGHGRTVNWTSADGRGWLRATNETGNEVARGVQTLVEAGGEVTAFVRDAESVDAATRPVEIWRTSGLAEWAKVGELPSSAGAVVFQAAQGSRGWVATGTTATESEWAAWTSADGIAWDRSPSAPGLVTALLADVAGFVAAGARSTSTGGCIDTPDAFVGRTWTSSDGRVWREVPSGLEWAGQGISQLVERDRLLIGVGLSYLDGRPSGAVWTADMPTTSVDTGPLPPATPRQTPAPGCGP